jgi:hypothetical protein
MRAIVQDRCGETDVLDLRDRNPSLAVDDEVLVDAPTDIRQQELGHARGKVVITT